MKKKLISTILAAITAISAVSAMSSNALYYWGTVDENLVAETFKDYVKLEDYKWLGRSNTKCMYYVPDEKQTTYFYEVYREKDRVTITVDANENIEEIRKKIQAIDENLYIRSYLIAPLNTKCHFDISADMISPETAKKIREQVGDVALEVNYWYNTHFYQNIIYNYLTAYHKSIEYYDNASDEYVLIDNSDKLREFAVSHSEYYDFIETEDSEMKYNGIQLMNDMIYLIPKEKVTKAEHIELAKEIYEATGYKPSGYGLESVPSSIGGSTLDLTNYLNGDANCDQKYTIADSTAILQALGNPDKYGLSTQGLFNADSTGDGLTVEDAVAIKTALAKGA